jgi:hypothetical protein
MTVMWTLVVTTSSCTYTPPFKDFVIIKPLVLLLLHSPRELKPYTPPLSSRSPPPARTQTLIPRANSNPLLLPLPIRPYLTPTLVKFVYFEQKGGFNELNLIAI